jgi:pre-mRNA-splicing factor ATP-dependent RNA helicase DHX16
MTDDSRWVREKLHSILGYSKDVIADYIVSIARKSTSVKHLLSELSKADLPTSNSNVVLFARDLFDRVHKNQPTKSTSSSNRSSTTTNVIQHDDNLNSFIAMDDNKQERKRKHKKDKKKRKSEHIRQSRDDDDNNNESAEPVVKRRRTEFNEQQQHESEPVQRELTAEEKKELERLEDQRQREELEQRLLDRESKNTKKKGPKDKQNNRQVPAEFENEQDKQQVFSKLRQIARLEYLNRREKDQLEQLEDQLAQDKRDFRDEELTKRERKERQAKEQVIQYARNREDVTKIDRYQMPDSYYDADKNKSQQDKRFAVLTKRYEEAPGRDVSEQQEWEQKQIGRAKMQFGALDRKVEQEYDYVLDEEIEFVAQDILQGKRDLPKELLELEEASKADKQKEEQDKKALSIQEVRKSLPVYPYRDQLLQAIGDHQVLVIVGETGSGKTTQLTQYLHEAGYTKDGKMIACTQPRRVAAMSVAARVAEEMGVKLGNEVGYSIRFEDCTSEKTVIKYMTDGMMLREFLGQPDLSSYSVIIVDEAHERSLHTDILFGLVKDIVRFRKDVKLLISSATIQAEKFSDYFDQAPIFTIPGRRYPVDILYTKAPESNYLEASVVTTLQIHLTQPSGDILVFLTGQDEIESADEMLKQRMKGLPSSVPELIIVPIYSTLPSSMQAKIFEKTPPGCRKVVLATNIAETSLTIDGIAYVIDCGFSKINSYNPRRGMESLIVTPISKASANQRAGRAGRVGPGKCFRLYTAWSFNNELEESPIPEIQRVNLANVVLQLKSLGINDLIHFDFLDAPPVETLIAALEHLYALGALNDKGELTTLGRKMAEFPLDPQLAKTLIASEKYECTEELVTICSMLTVNNSIFFRPKDKAVHADNARKNFFRPGGDHMTLLAVYNEWASEPSDGLRESWCKQNFIQSRSMKRAKQVRDQLVALMERVEIELISNPHEDVAIRKAITSGFFYHVASLQKSGNYKTFHKPQTVHIHPSSSLYEQSPKWLLYHELVFTSKEFMRQVIQIDPQWLPDIAPHLYQDTKIEEATRKMPKGVGKASTK